MNCYYCGIETNLDYCNFSNRQMTLDRVFNHDSHRINSVLIACLKCNTARSNDYSSADFKQLLQ